MSWYISPPGGNIALHKLTQFAVTRFNFLCKLYDTGGNQVEMFDIVKEHETVLSSECLIEGTAKDKVSHFILRLACCKNEEMRDFFVKAETMLFDFRLSCMTENELCKLFKSLDHYTKSLKCRSNHSNLPLFIEQFLETMLEIRGCNSRWRTVVRQYLKGETSCFTVPFQTVLQFVRTRQVILRNGIAHVPACKLRETVTSLYEKLLIGGMKRASEIFYSEDERVIELVRTIKVLYRRKYGLTRGIYHNNLQNNLSHTDVDDLVHMFPPCMTHLHQTLRDNHRLRHHSRLQYTLFLKEAGLPVHEALMFWRKEYSLPHKNQDGCTHDWSKNESRYTYNIRHLYGLEGSRVNYRGHSCAALQENYHGPHEDGGCPFSHFDSANLGKLLEKQGISKNTEVIQHLAASRKFCNACCLFFEEKAKALEVNRICGQVENLCEQRILQSEVVKAADTQVFDRTEMHSDASETKHSQKQEKMTQFNRIFDKQVEYTKLTSKKSNSDQFEADDCKCDLSKSKHFNQKCTRQMFAQHHNNNSMEIDRMCHNSLISELGFRAGSVCNELSDSFGVLTQNDVQHNKCMSYKECMTSDTGHELVKCKNFITSDAIETKDTLSKTLTSIQKAVESHRDEKCFENIETVSQCIDNGNAGYSVIKSSPTVIVKPIDYFTSYSQITNRHTCKGVFPSNEDIPSFPDNMKAI